MEAANQTIRKAAKAARVPLWMLAERIGVSEPTMTRKLRRELDGREQEKILAIIAEIAREKEAADGEQ